MLYVCHCMCIEVESNHFRRIYLLGIAHPVMGKYFQVLEVHRELRQVQEFSYEKGRIMAYSSIFLIFWIEFPVLHT